MGAKQNPNNVIRIPTSVTGNFFRYWFEFLRPFHKLTNREIDIITAFAKKRFELSKQINDSTILDKFLMSDDVKKEIRDECNISQPHFQVIMGELKNSKVIIDNKINPKFIPNLIEEDGSFRLLLLFDLK